MIRAVILSLVLVACGSSAPLTIIRPSLPESRIVGHDWLAAQHPLFNLGAALEALPEDSAIGVLHHTFGEDMHPIRLILGSGKVSHFRVHFLNGACVRNRNCGAYEITGQRNIQQFEAAVRAGNPSIVERFDSAVGQYCELIDEFPSVQFYFSWILEHNLSKDGWLTLNYYGRQACPRDDYFVVNNPVDANPNKDMGTGELFEDHGQWPASPVISSLDGKDVLDINIWAWLRRTETQSLTFSWTHAYNCRLPSGPFIDPRDRVACPSPERHAELINLVGE